MYIHTHQVVSQTTTTLGGWAGLSLALLVLIIAGFVILGGKSVVLVLLLGLVKVLLSLFFNELLGLFRCLPGSGRALLAGTLLLRYCATRFACRTPTWRLPVSGHVAGLVIAIFGVAGEAVVDCAAHEISWVSGSGPGRKRIRLNRKTPAHLVVSMVQSRPRFWKRLRHVGFSSVSIPDHKRRRGDQDDGGCNPVHIRTRVR